MRMRVDTTNLNNGNQVDAMPTPSLWWFVVRRDVFCMCHGPKAPSDAEWTRCLAALSAFATAARSQGVTPKAIVFTDGGAPSVAQRAGINALVGASPPTAVVASAMAIRFVVSSFALLNPNIGSFSPDQLPAALTHLGITHAAPVLRTVERMSKEHAIVCATLARALKSSFAGS